MKVNAMILNFMRYKDKETQQPKVRIGYICTDKDSISNEENFRGYSELSIYLNDDAKWNDLDVSIVGTACTLEFEKYVNPRNPLKEVTKLKAIDTKNANISIL